MYIIFCGWCNRYYYAKRLDECCSKCNQPLDPKSPHIFSDFFLARGHLIDMLYRTDIVPLEAEMREKISHLIQVHTNLHLSLPLPEDKEITQAIINSVK